MRVIYDQVRADKEMRECTFLPNKGVKKKVTAARHHRGNTGLGKTKEVSVNLISKKGS